MTNIYTFCQQSIIYFTASSPKIVDWIKDESIQKILQPYAKWHYIERDLAMFNVNIDEDYVPCLQVITRASFCSVYLDWIQFCARKRVEVRVNFRDFFSSISFNSRVMSKIVHGYSFICPGLVEY